MEKLALDWRSAASSMVSLQVGTDIREILADLPAKPGIYLMKDAQGKTLYVGKAKNLRARVRSYFQASADHTPKVARLVEHVASLDFIVTGSDLDALLLENSLIKEHRPPYNVMLRDDKSYPYIRVTLAEDYPRVLLTRRMTSDGSQYFGPYTSAGSARETLEALRRVFPYVSCSREVARGARRACLYYHISRCLAPCVGAVGKDEYRQMIEEICLFLSGRQDEVLERIGAEMEEAARRMEFERAASLRDRLRSAVQVVEHHKLLFPSLSEQDIIALAREDRDALAQVFIIRRGRLMGREHFLLTGAEEEEVSAVMASFLQQFYSRAAHIPPEILLEVQPEEAKTIAAWLSQRRGRKVNLRVPQRGQKRRLVEMVAENAAETLAQVRREWERDTQKALAALAGLKEALKLPTLPKRIECYDISTLQGRSATGSMVVFQEGKPLKGAYRHFQIKTVEGSDDFAMLREVISRRIKRSQAPEAKAPWRELPDLLIVDGGRGQVGAARQALEALGQGELPLAGLAKEREELFLPGESAPITLPEDAPARHLAQRIRDEAHRFAVSYHHTLHRSQSLASTLEEVPGIGPKRRRALLKRFGSLEAIRQAALQELATVEGMTLAAARSLKENL